MALLINMPIRKYKESEDLKAVDRLMISFMRIKIFTVIESSSTPNNKGGEEKMECR